jgi:D-sedoheptulose 7-phosphate isomerase
MNKQMKDKIISEISSSIQVKQDILNDSEILNQIQKLSTDCISSLLFGGKIIFAGNGGSFADAQHISAEFTSRFLIDRAPLASLALGTNSSAMSAIGNDYGYENIFARELRSIARKGDVFIPISTSGNSANILAAVSVAKELALTTMVWTGQSGGKLKVQSECLCVPSSETARIQECHILLGHILCGLVEDGCFNRET